MKTAALGTLGLALGLGLTPVNGIELGDDMGSVLLDTRIRYEAADLDTLESSNALTGRVRAGYQSKDMNGFSFLAELEATIPVDEGSYDAYPGSQGTAGKTIIADPRNFELNRLQINWKGDNMGAVVGRQRIIRNNARFVGNVGWRQNEQTFDAISLSQTPYEGLDLFYSYLDRAQRIFGKKADVKAQREFEMTSHIVELQYQAQNGITAGAYGYLLGIDNSPALSSDTFGVWASGSTEPEDGISFLWRAEFARQLENRDSIEDADFDLSYHHFVGGIKKAGWGTFSIGYESLEGDGSRGFSTPLATLHAFNGFADVFLNTPADGLKDIYLKAVLPLIDGVSTTIFYHEFESESGSVDYGREYDFVLGYMFNKNLSCTAKLALFEGDNKPDISRFFLQLDGKF